MNNNKWNDGVKASPDDLYEVIDVAALRERNALKKGLALVTLAVSGLLAGGCAGDATQEPNEIVLDENGQPVESAKNDGKTDNTDNAANPANKDKSTKTRSCSLQLKSIIHINPVGGSCQTD